MRSMLLLWFVGLDIRVIFSGLQTRAQSNTAKHTQNTAQFFFFTLLCSVVLCVCEKYYCVLCDVVFCVVFRVVCIPLQNCNKQGTRSSRTVNYQHYKQHTEHVLKNQTKASKTLQMLQTRAILSISWKILRNLVLAAHAKKGFPQDRNEATI